MDPTGELPKVELENREYLLFSDDLSMASTMPGESDFFGFYQSPNLWWPDDKAWFVTTDVDLCSTYVGASEECVAELLKIDQLKTEKSSPDAEVSGRTDDCEFPRIA